MELTYEDLKLDGSFVVSVVQVSCLELTYEDLKLRLRRKTITLLEDVWSLPTRI